MPAHRLQEDDTSRNAMALAAAVRPGRTAARLTANPRDKDRPMPRFNPACAAALLLAAAGIIHGAQAADVLPPDDELVQHTDQSIAAWWLRPEEKRFDEIGWADGLLAARRLSAETGWPVFLFTMDGRVNTGRC